MLVARSCLEPPMRRIQVVFKCSPVTDIPQMNRSSATGILHQYIILNFNSIATDIQLHWSQQTSLFLLFVYKIRSLEVGGCWHQLCHLMMPSKTLILSIVFHSYLHTYISRTKQPLQFQHQVQVQSKGRGKWEGISFPRCSLQPFSSYVSVVHGLHDHS